ALIRSKSLIHNMKKFTGWTTRSEHRSVVMMPLEKRSDAAATATRARSVAAIRKNRRPEVDLKLGADGPLAPLPQNKKGRLLQRKPPF
ncbi:MAG: hypothetical protein EA369_07030, partial [Bradymonadales bacterium]